MKLRFFVILVLITAQACVKAPTSTTSSVKSNTEMEARRVTNEMKTVLNLDITQEGKILVINVVNFAILKKLRDNNQTQEIATTKEKYRKEVKQVLNPNQFS
jgi:hypothetical protein